MGEQGIVLDVIGDSIKVSMERKEACAKCRACLAGYSNKEMILTIKNDCNAKPNDKVNIEVETSYAIKAVFIMYGTPLVFLLTGFIVGHYFAQFAGLLAAQEPIMFFAGMGFMVLAFLYIKKKDKQIDKRLYTPVATAVIVD